MSNDLEKQHVVSAKDFFYLMGMFAGSSFENEDMTTFCKVLKEAEHGDEDTIALAKNILLEMDHGLWNWQHHWFHFAIHEDWTLMPKINGFVHIINKNVMNSNPLYSFKRMFQDFQIEPFLL